MNLLSAPLDIFLSITHKCNLECIHCSVYPATCGKEELATNKLIKLIDELSGLKIFTVRISGGEPFVRKDIFKIIEKICKSSMRLSINTNAMLITAKKAKQLSEFAPKIDDIMVSIDGATAKTHDFLRGKGGFNATVRGMEYLLKHFKCVSIYTTVIKKNFTEIGKITLMAKKMGVEGVKFNELLPIGMGLKYYKDLSLNAEERKLVIKKLKQLKSEYGGFVTGTYLDLCEIFSSSQNIKDPPSLNGCGATLNGCAILPDGSVVPCDRLQGLVAGNIREKTLREIWLHSEGFKLFRKRFKKTLNDIKECSSCGYKAMCTGGCPAVSFALTGNTIARDPLSCYRIFRGEEIFNG